MLNRIILIGRLTRDPELRYIPNGQPVASFSLAVDRPFKSQDGQKQTDFIDVVVWRKLAEQVSQYATKGRLVAVEGRPQIRSYETQDGQKRKVAEVVADGVRFLDSNKNAAKIASPRAEDDGIPTDQTSAQEPVPATASASDEEVPF